MTSTVYIAKNVYGGDGLGRLGDGRVVFVPGAWAGEQVKAEIVEEKRHFVKARLVEVVEASPDRLAAPDPSVPGMVYAGLSYAGECAAKEQQLRESFERAHLALPGDAATPLLAPTKGENGHYRNKVVYHFGCAEKGKGKGARGNGGARDWKIGYRLEPSHEIVDVTEDPLARPEINAKLPEIRKAVLTLLTTGPEAVRRDVAAKANVTIRWTKKTGVKWWIGAAPKDVILTETTCGREFDVPADGFYQVNPVVGDELAETVVAEYKKGAALAPNVLDLYCGVGVFGLSCGAPKLIGIESGRQAIDFAKRNAANQLQRMPSASTANFRFFAEEVGRNTRRIPVGAHTTVIVDPPRDGLERGVPEWLAASRAPRILYVSCDPATLVRDLKALSRSYKIESVRWFNMFPRTARFETLVVLTAGN